MKLQKFRSGFSRVVVAIGYIGLASLFLMTFIIAIDVILRKIGGSAVRINGSNELTAFAMVILCSLWIPALHVRFGHIWVPLFVDKFPYRFRCFWLFGISVVETAVIAMIVIGAYRKLIDMIATGRNSDVLGIPWWIVTVFLFLGFVEFFILSLIDMIQLFIDGVRNENPKTKEDGWSDDEVKGI